LNFVLNASISSASSKTDMLPLASRISSLLSVAVALVCISSGKTQAFLGR
jgi:hypothetical protein